MKCSRSVFFKLCCPRLTVKNEFYIIVQYEHLHAYNKTKKVI